MNKKMIWLMFAFLLVPLLFANQPVSKAASEWSDWMDLGGIMVSSPTICSIDNKLAILVVGTNRSPWVRTSRDGERWSDWNDLRVRNVADATLVSNNDDNYIITRMTDNRILGIPVDLKQQANREAYRFRKPAQTSSCPTAVTFNDKIYLFFRGMDNRIYMSASRAPFGRIIEIPGNGRTISEPRAAVIRNQIYLIVRGTDDGIYLNIMTSEGSWKGWREIPGRGKSLSGPAIGEVNGKIYVMVRGTDDGIYVTDWKTEWSDWRKIGGKTSSSPCFATFNNELYAVVRGMDNHAYICTLEGDSDEGHGGHNGDDGDDGDDGDGGHGGHGGHGGGHHGGSRDDSKDDDSTK